jgi:hypothetical protein
MSLFAGRKTKIIPTGGGFRCLPYLTMCLRSGKEQKNDTADRADAEIKPDTAFSLTTSRSGETTDEEHTENKQNTQDDAPRDEASEISALLDTSVFMDASCSDDSSYSTCSDLSMEDPLIIRVYAVNSQNRPPAMKKTNSHSTKKALLLPELQSPTSGFIPPRDIVVTSYTGLLEI